MARVEYDTRSKLHGDKWRNFHNPSRQHSRRSLENYYVIDMDSLETLHVDLVHYKSAPLLSKEALITNKDESGNGSNTISNVKAQCTTMYYIILYMDLF